MSLIVNQNLSAMNAHHYMKTIESSFNRSVEKLSSGLRINRAADDPAGLVISEKFRAQVDGLKQAIRNAKDGISLVQTAEGALDEFATILRSMRNLALHAANTGATDPAAAAADQAQIKDAIATLNRIANTTSFGTQKLLNGSSGVSGSATNAQVSFISGTSATVAGTYAVQIDTAATQGVRTSTAAREVNHGFIGNNDTTGAADYDRATKAYLDFTDAAGGAIGAQIEIDNNGGAKSTADVVNLINAQINPAGYTAEINGDGKLEIRATDTNQLLQGFTMDVTGEDGDDVAAIQTTLGLTAVEYTSTGDLAGLTATLGLAETLTFTDGTTSATVNLLANDNISTAITKMQLAFNNAGFAVTAGYDDVAGEFTLTNNEYGDETVALVRVSSSIAEDLAQATGLSAGVATTAFIAEGGGLSGVTGANVEGSIGGITATGTGQTLSGPADTTIEGLVLKYTGTTTGAKGSVVIEQNSLQFQIGAFANETVSLTLGDLRANMLGTTATGITFMTNISVADIDVTQGHGAGAQDAIRVLDAAITQVSILRAEMGSFQKDTLEASVRNLGIAAQNMASSESTIRDADMAEEMMAFSRAQILQQTSMAMLAQANQAPQMIMRLFQ
jgi:flagellin